MPFFLVPTVDQQQLLIHVQISALRLLHYLPPNCFLKGSLGSAPPVIYKHNLRLGSLIYNFGMSRLTSIGLS